MAAKHELTGGVLVAGAINTDLVARVERAPAAGETVTGSAFAIFGGGKGANQAVAAARFGAKVAMVGALGQDDFGRQRLADLEYEGIDTGAVALTSDAASGVALIVVEEESGQNRIAYVPGATVTVAPETAAAAIARVRPAVLLLTLELPPPTLDRLVADARAIGATVVLNASPEPDGARPLLGRTDVLLVNETETADLLGRPFASAEPTAAAEAALALAALGPSVVVVTLGAAGAVVAAGGMTTAISAPSVAVVDTTGAGDAFTGALVARLSAGSDAFAAARAGVVAGSLATTRAGAQPSMPRREEIERMLAA